MPVWPVWIDANGNRYDSWNQLTLDHLKNVVVLLTKRAKEGQREWNRYTFSVIEYQWRQTLITLEDASRALRNRLDSADPWALDSAPKTPQEALISAGNVLGEAPRRKSKQRGTSLSEGKIVELPRKLRIEEAK